MRKLYFLWVIIAACLFETGCDKSKQGVAKELSSEVNKELQQLSNSLFFNRSDYYFRFDEQENVLQIDLKTKCNECPLFIEEKISDYLVSKLLTKKYFKTSTDSIRIFFHPSEGDTIYMSSRDREDYDLLMKSLPVLQSDLFEAILFDCGPDHIEILNQLCLSMSRKYEWYKFGPDAVKLILSYAESFDKQFPLLENKEKVSLYKEIYTIEWVLEQTGYYKTLEQYQKLLRLAESQK